MHDVARRSRKQTRARGKKRIPANRRCVSGSGNAGAMVITDEGCRIPSRPELISTATYPTADIARWRKGTSPHSIQLNAETCLSSIWRCRLADTFPSRPPSPIGMLVVLPAGKLRYRLARVRFWLLILVRFHCHRAPFVSAGTGPLLASDPGSLSLPSSAVRHSIHLNAETCLSSIWRCRLADTFPSRPPSPIGMLVVLPAGKLRYRLARVRFWLLILVRFHCHRAPFGIQFI